MGFMEVWKRIALFGAVMIACGAPAHAQGPGEIPYWATMNRPQGVPLAVQHFDRLQTQVQQTGVTRVIVRFKEAAESFTAEGELAAPAAVQKQRGAIQRNGDQLLQRLPPAAREKAKRFEQLPYMALELDEGAFYDLLNSPEVDLIEEDLLVSPALAESVALVGSDGNGLFAGYSGAGQTVAILDTGVDKTHPFLTGKIVAEACYSTNGSGVSSFCPNGQTEQVGAGAGIDCYGASGCGHGTHVAGIAAGKGAGFSGVAKDASIIAIQVFSKFTSCSGASPCAMSYTSDQIKALLRVYELRGTYNIAAVNMSLGGGSYSSYCDGSHSAIKSAIDTLRSAGIATVIASGNSGYTASISGPACVSTAVSVGSTTKADAVASYSNSVSWLSLLAPGSAIYSSTQGGGFASWNGTSMAAPHVAGAWAVLKSKKPTATVDEILTALQSSGRAVTDGRNSVIRPRIKIDSALPLIVPDTRLRFSSPSYLVSEGAGAAVIAVRREGSTQGAVSVNWSTSNGTASAGSDYVAASGTLSFADGEGGEKTFQVHLVNDTVAEPSKTVHVTLSNPVGSAALVTPSNAVLTIVDDDQAAGLITVPTSNGTGVYTITWVHNAPAGAWYELQEATDADFGTARTVFRGTVPGWTVAKQSNGQYYYRVRTVFSADMASGWSVGQNPCSVSMAVCSAPPSIIVPAGSSSGKYTISWGSSSTVGVSYELWEATDAGFTENVHLVYSGTGKSFSAIKSENDTFYYRARAVKAGASPSDWRLGSGGVAVTLACGAPASVTVPVTSSTGAYTISWTASDIPGSSYTLEQAKDAGFTVGVTTVYAGTQTSAKIVATENATYFYRVKAHKDGFAPSAWRSGVSGCAVVLACGIPASMAVPATSTTGAILLKWGASNVPGVTYVVEEARDASFSSGLRTIYTGTALQSEVVGLSNGSFYYRVRATKGGFAASPWKIVTAPCQVTLQAAAGSPVPAFGGFVVPPANSTGTVLLAWNASTLASVTYEVQEASNASFTQNLRTVYKGTALKTSAIVTANGTYYYRVRGTKTGHAPTAWVNAAAPCVVALACGTPATLTVPLGSTTGAVLLKWTASDIPGVTYEIEKANDSGFATGVVQLYRGTALSSTVTVPAAGTSHFRVRATKPGYAASAWRTGSNSCAMAPACGPSATLSYPAADGLGAVKVSWGLSNIAGVTYELEMATNASFTGATQVYVGTAASFTVPIAGNGTYYFRVRAGKPGYTSSVWKSGTSGCAVSLAIPVLAGITIPKTNAAGTFVVSWGSSKVPGSLYALEEAMDSNFADAKLVYVGPELKTTLTGRPGGTYYYRVKAFRSGYAESAWKVGANGCVVTTP